MADIYTRENLGILKKSELKSIAKESGCKGYSGLRKSDLIDFIIDCQELKSLGGVPEIIDVQEHGILDIDSFLDMPNEIIYEVVKNLSPADFFNLCASSPRFARVCDDKYFVNKMKIEKKRDISTVYIEKTEIFDFGPRSRRSYILLKGYIHISGNTERFAHHPESKPIRHVHKSLKLTHRESGNEMNGFGNRILSYCIKYNYKQKQELNLAIKTYLVQGIDCDTPKKKMEINQYHLPNLREIDELIFNAKRFVSDRFEELAIDWTNNMEHLNTPKKVNKYVRSKMTRKRTVLGTIRKVGY